MIRKISTRSKSRRADVLGLALAALVAASQPRPRSRQPRSFPPAASILERYVEAAGGKAAHDLLKNRVTRFSTEFVGMGVTIDTTVHAERPNHAYSMSNPR